VTKGAKEKQILIMASISSNKVNKRANNKPIEYRKKLRHKIKKRTNRNLMESI